MMWGGRGDAQLADGRPHEARGWAASVRRRPRRVRCDFCNVTVGVGMGGVLAAMMFFKGADGWPRCTAEEALAFVAGCVVKD